MYESHFGLENRPFLAAPVADRYYAAASIEEARRNLMRAIERSEGPGLVIGPAGVGKSLLCQVLAAQCKDKFAVAMLSSARLCTRRALLQAIFHGVGLPYREREEGELRLSLIDYLNELPNSKQGLLLIVDEAHALPLRLLEEIRMITNLVRSGVATVRLILAGAPALEERFANPKLDSLNQRIAARCYLQPFESNETQQYIRAQLAICGTGASELMTDDALQAIHHATGGIPRLINQLCDHTLVLACAGGVASIDAAVVEEAWGDLQQLPVPWTPDRDLRGRGDEQDVVEFGTFDDEVSGSTEADDDDHVASLRFPHATADKASARLDEIESQLSSLDDDFQPAGVIRPEVELVFPEPSNPFDESFETEEVVLDQYATLDDSIWKNRPKVTNRGRERFTELEAGSPPKVDIRLAEEAGPDYEVLELETDDADEAHETAETTTDDDLTCEAAAELDWPIPTRTDADPKLEPNEPIDVVEAENAEMPAEIGLSHSELIAALDPVMPEAWDSATDAIPHYEPAAQATSSWYETESDVIVIIDDEEDLATAKPPVPKIQRREYRQLFARLRKG